MRVKNLMVLMMLLMLPILGKASDIYTPPSATAGVRTDYVEPSSVVTIASNLYKHLNGSLNGQDQLTHTKTAIFAAAHLENGGIASWYNPDNGTAGRIKVVLTKPVQGGYCRLLFTEVEKGANIRQYSEYACKTIDNQFWTFSTR